MTALRPEREDSSYGGSYEPSYESPYEPPYGSQEPYGGPSASEAGSGYAGYSDPFADPDADPYAAGFAPYAEPYADQYQEPYQEPAAYPDASGYAEVAYGDAAYAETAYAEPAYVDPGPGAYGEPDAEPYGPLAYDGGGMEPPEVDWAEEADRAAVIAGMEPPAEAVSRETATEQPVTETVTETAAETAAEPVAPATGGRAARRKAAQEAAKRRGKRRRGAPVAGASATTAGGTSSATGDASPAPAPTSRLAARQAARARKESLGVVVSRVTGEAFITIGVLMLLFVAYQLWWTNVLAHNEAGGAANNLQQQWDDDKQKRDPGAFSPGEGFAIMYIPKLDVKVPIAEGIDKQTVLDRGMVGHYGEGALKTAMPWDKQGNFAVAGHRNTHGEPFRYINRLSRGDEIIVETRHAFYTYEMASILPQTPPSNVSVIGPVPPGSGFTGPGRYLTLTTCTPEFTSTYRLIVWGKMVEERPRSQGKPDALVS